MAYPPELEVWWGTRWHNRALELHRQGNKVVPCKFCLAPAMWPNKECENCAEVVARLPVFLRNGRLQAVMFVAKEFGRVLAPRKKRRVPKGV